MAVGGNQWFAVYTKPEKEEYAELNLRLRGIDTFFPKLSFPQSVRRKRQVAPLFPNYLFVRFEIASGMWSVMWCPGVKRIVSFNGCPAVVEESVMGFLMAQANPNGVISAHCNVAVGQEVSIDGGPFDGLIGIIQEPPNAKGRVKVLLQILNRPTKVDVPVQYINANWVTAGPTA